MKKKAFLHLFLLAIIALTISCQKTKDTQKPNGASK
jgi:hypothetical protein